MNPLDNIKTFRKPLYKVEHYGKDKQEWLKHRGFGGSSVSALFGKNKYLNELDIYCSAVNPSDEKHDNQTSSTIHGKKAEKPICDIFALHHEEYEVIYPKDITMYRRIRKPFMTYTADALLIEKATHRKGIYEGKTRVIQNKQEADEWRDGILPEQYVIQVLQGLAVLNDYDFIELCVELIFVDYDTGKWKCSEIRSFHLEREQCKNAIKKVEKVQTDFHHNHIVKRIPPDLKIEIEIDEE